MRRLLLSAAALTVLSGPLAAQNRISWLDVLTPDRLVQQMVQVGIMMLRTQMDVKYGDMSVDLMSGRVTLTDVRMWPLPPWDTDFECEIGIDRLTIRSGGLEQIDRLRFKALASGASAPAACLPPEGQQMLGMAGLDRLDIPRLTLDVDYGVPGSEAVARVFGVVENAAAVDLTADFSYVWFDGRKDMEEPDPVAYLRNARLTVENRGIWEALKGQLPPPATDPEAGTLYVEGAVGSILSEMNGGEALGEAQKAFLASVAEVWPKFLSDPDTLVLETDLSGDAFLDFEAMERSPAETFDTLKPRLALASSGARQVLPASLISQAMGPEAGALAEADRRKVGLALISGDGAPRDLQGGFALLSPLAKAGDAEAALALSAALETRSPEDAYQWALVAGRGGAEGATARLDRLEGQLDFATVLKLQEEVSGGDSHPTDALNSIAGVRDQAAMRLTGRGQARSYPVAAMWAMLGKALGDAESGDILADIDERVGAAGADAQAAWQAAEERASELALEAWLGQDLPGRFSR